MFDLTAENIAYIFTAVMIGIILSLIFGRLKKRYPYYAQDFLLTKAEQKFYHILKKAIAGQYDIACKVRLADIINCSERNWQRGYGGQIACKHIDFVLFNSNNSKILLTLELDDKSHEKPERQKRDIFVNNALAASNVPLLRIPVTRHYDLETLQKDIEQELKHD